MVLKKENGEDILIVTNNFDDPATDEDYMVVMDILKQRANLEVNADKPVPTTTTQVDSIWW